MSRIPSTTGERGLVDEFCEPPVRFDIWRIYRSKGSTGAYIKEPSVCLEREDIQLTEVNCGVPLSKMAITSSRLSVGPSLETLSESASEGLPVSLPGSLDSSLATCCRPLIAFSAASLDLASVAFDFVDLVDLGAEVFLLLVFGDMIAT